MIRQIKEEVYIVAGNHAYKVTDMYEFRTVVFMQLSVGALTHTLLYRQTPITAG